VFDNSRDNAHIQVKRIKLSQKVLYHFTIFAIVNEILVMIVEWVCIR